MYSGTLIFGSRIEGVQFETITISSAEPVIQKIEIAGAEDGNISMTIHVAGVGPLDDATEIGLREATRIAKLLAFQLGRRVENPFPKSAYLRDEARNVTSVDDYMGFTPWCKAVNQLGAETLTSLISALNHPQPPGEADYQLFRACLNTGDAASRFLALYRLLGRLADPTGKDRQSMIDAVIRTHEPGVEETPSPKTGVLETVYSRLRNEYVHRDVPLPQVCYEMEGHLDGLITVVGEAIRIP
jgi:hypothetical protein